MKKFFNNIKNKVNSLAIRTKCAVDNVRAEGYVDSGVKILIAVVIGALHSPVSTRFSIPPSFPLLPPRYRHSSTTRVNP